MSDYSQLTALRDRLRHASANIMRVARSDMDVAAEQVRDQMRQRAPVDTGNLRDSIAILKIAGRYEIGPVNVPYAAAQEYGAKPHVIIASPGKVLVFTINGEKKFATKVNHPGNKPHPYIRPAGEWAHENLPEMIAVSGARLLKGKNA